MRTITHQCSDAGTRKLWVRPYCLRAEEGLVCWGGCCCLPPRTACPASRVKSAPCLEPGPHFAIKNIRCELQLVLQADLVLLNEMKRNQGVLQRSGRQSGGRVEATVLLVALLSCQLVATAARKLSHGQIVASLNRLSCLSSYMAPAIISSRQQRPKTGLPGLGLAWLLLAARAVKSNLRLGANSKYFRTIAHRCYVLCSFTI
mgnify:CR=1 FL=1